MTSVSYPTEEKVMLYLFPGCSPIKRNTPKLSVCVPAEKLVLLFFIVTETLDKGSPAGDLTIPVTSVRSFWASNEVTQNSDTSRQKNFLHKSRSIFMRNRFDI
jgi:hypothetical protein